MADSHRRRVRARLRAGGAPYLKALSYLVLCTVLAYLAEPYVSSSDLALLYLAAMVLIALRFDYLVSGAAGVASILAFDFLFVPPHFAFAWGDDRYAFTFAVMVAASGVISVLSQRLRQQEKRARETAVRTKALYELNAELSKTCQPRQLAAITVRHLERLFSARVRVLLGDSTGALQGSLQPIAPEELARAEEAFTSGELVAHEAGSGYSLWVPLLGVQKHLGVVGLDVAGPFDRSSESGLLLMACASQLATAFDRTELADAARRSELEAETERLRSSLLSAVAHDLKTPLATMIAAGTTLLAEQQKLPLNVVDDLLSTIVGQGERLSRLIQKLLSAARLESPTIELRRSPESFEEILAAVLDRLSDELHGRRIDVDLAPDLPWLLAEPALIEQVLWNLLENALAYTLPSSAIHVSARGGDGFVVVQIADEGPGIPEREREKVFERFYRGQQARKGDGGVGLGLTICRAVIHAHGGRIVIRERNGGGTLVEFTLPLAAALNPEGVSGAAA